MHGPVCLQRNLPQKSVGSFRVAVLCRIFSAIHHRQLLTLSLLPTCSPFLLVGYTVLAMLKASWDDKALIVLNRPGCTARVCASAKILPLQQALGSMHHAHPIPSHAFPTHLAAAAERHLPAGRFPRPRPLLSGQQP